MSRENLCWFILGVALTIVIISHIGDELWGSDTLTIPQEVEIHLDTLRYENPLPRTVRVVEGVSSFKVEEVDNISAQPITVTPSEPIHCDHPDHSETLHVALPPRDSIYTFADTLSGRWELEVEGRDVRLRSLLLVDRVEQHRSVSYERPAWEVSLMSSISYTSQWFGVGIGRNFGRANITFEAGYDPYLHAPHIELNGSLRLWDSR